MKIGVAGPITLRMLQHLFPAGTQFPETYSFPLIAMLAEKLYRKGQEVVVFALSSAVSETQLTVGDRIQAYVCPQRRPRWRMLDFWRGERIALRDAMRKSNCDVIHAHWTYEFGAAAVESGLPHVITAHDVPMAVLRFARHPYWLEKPFLAWPVVRRARHMTAVSPYVADSLHRFLRPQKDIIVIPNGVAQAVFHLYERRRQKHRSGTLVFASVLNGWGGRKNGQQLIKAFALLRHQLGAEVELWMFGDEHESGGPAHRWASEQSLNSGIRFLGAVPYGELLSTLAQKVDVFVHPALEEAHSMAVTEAMAIGLPVIAGRYSGGIPWALADGHAGLLVDVASARSIMEGMYKLAEEADLRGALAKAAHELALREYHIDEVTNRYAEILARASTERAH